MKLHREKQYCEEAFELYDKFEKEDTEMYASQNKMGVYSDEYLRDNEWIGDIDSSFVLSESGSNSCSDFDSNSNKDDTKSTTFIVFWSSLIILFEKYFTCFLLKLLAKLVAHFLS